MKKYLLPKKIILVDGEIKNTNNLFVKKDMQIGLSESSFTEMVGQSTLLLDFGQEICGGIRLLIYNFTNLPVKLRIVFGESISEALSNIGEKNSTNDHSVRDYEINTTNLCDIETGQTGFRYVRIIKLSEKPVVRFKNIYAVSNYSFSNKANFKCDDSLINEIYKTATRTVNLCVQNGYVWDGVKRDRLVWIGDLYPEFISLCCLHRNIKEIKNSLLFIKNQTKLPSWMNNIPMYSMWWLIIIYDYCYREDDFDFLVENKEYILKLTNQILQNINENGETIFEKNFLDWPTSDCADEIIGVHALTIICLKKVILMYDYFNLNIDKVEEKLNLLLIKDFNVNNKKQVKALIAIAKNDFSENTLKFLVENNSSGFSTFMSYFILSAIFESDGQEKSVELMKEYYGAMLKYGATTFFEDFDISWINNSFGIDSLPIDSLNDLHGDFGQYCYSGFRHSLCHGWSAGVIAFIVEKIVGVKEIEPGGKKILIDPYMGNLRFINYNHPTAVGNVIIKLYKEGNNVYCEYETHNNIEVIVKNAIVRKMNYEV